MENVEYLLNFFNRFDELVGSLNLVAPRDSVAILIADGIAATKKDRRAKLWDGIRVVKLYAYS